MVAEERTRVAEERTRGYTAAASLLLSTSILLFTCAYHVRQTHGDAAAAEATKGSFESILAANSTNDPEGKSVSFMANGDPPLSGQPPALQPVEFKTPKGVDYKVDVEVFMESQDPSSQIFTEWVLVQVIGAPGVLDIIRLRMIPWGQAKLVDMGQGMPIYTVERHGNMTNVTLDPKSPSPSFLCIHGPSECEGNVWISCIQELYPDILRWFRVTTCIQARSCAEGQAPSVDSVAHTGAINRHPCEGLPHEVAPGCVREFGMGMEVPKIQACIHSRLGSELLLRNMVETEALDPPFHYLPWVRVDGQVLNFPNRTNVFLLGKAICDAYVSKIQPYVNGTVPSPLACYYFPSDPPYLPKLPQADTWGISLLWAIGGVCFVSGVMILVCWKYHSSFVPSKGEDDADSP